MVKEKGEERRKEKMLLRVKITKPWDLPGLMFLMKWKDNDKSHLRKPTSAALQIVITFYEERFIWVTPKI